MPARIVRVHDDPDFLNAVTTALRGSGSDVAVFDDSMRAWDAFDAANRVELLITKIEFASGKPHGVTLARRALSSRLGVRILFIDMPKVQSYTEGLGVFLPMPVGPTEILQEVSRMLAESRSDDRVGGVDERPRCPDWGMFAT